MSLKLCREIRARLLSGYPVGREIPREHPNATSQEPGLGLTDP